MPEPPYDDEAFCVYCQKQYASPKTLRQHVFRKHEGTTRYWAYIEADAAVDLDRLMGST
jgi:hypothetical protein